MFAVSKFIVGLGLVFAGGLYTEAAADNISNPGDSDVEFEGSPWLTFASSEVVSGSPGGFQVNVDSSGNTVWNSSSMGFINTAQTVGAVIYQSTCCRDPSLFA